MTTVRFENLAAGGEAVGRDESGRAVFAPRAAPGDVAEIALEKQSKTFARGRVLQILQPSPHRVIAPCPYFHDDTKTSCGGCAWQHVSHDAQIAAKRALVRDALQRLGGVADAEELVAPCVPSPRAFAYRNKADFVAAQNGELQVLGFFAPDSHCAIDVARCLIQENGNNAILAAAREALALGLVAPFDAASGRGVLRRLVARTSSSGQSLVCAVTSRVHWPQERAFAEHMRRAVPSLVGVLRREPQRDARLIGDGNLSRDWLEETVGDLRLRVSGEGFFQVNAALVETLAETALRLANVQREEKILDLFCGVGLFSLALAKCGARVVGIERSASAVRDAKSNAALNGLEAEFLAGDAAGEMRRLAARGETFSCIFLDPPRAGAAECLPAILQLMPRRIVYVSCDPATLARDVKTLSGEYVLRAAVPLDLFPQTAHVETVALLEQDGTSLSRALK